MKNNLFKIIYTVIFLLLTIGVFAENVPQPGVPPPGLPIDGGLLTLLAVGFGYGVKKLRNKK